MTNEEAIKDIEENIMPSVGGISLHMAIEALQERKTGKWVVFTDCEGKRRTNTCPFCGDKRETFGYTPKYCEECGARLEAGE